MVKATLFLWILAAAAASPPHATRTTPTREVDKTCGDIRRRSDALLSLNEKLGRFSGTVLILKDGRTILKKGYGMANYAKNVPNLPETKFRIGSVTKQFTAAAILQLWERGRLKLDDRLSRWFPEYGPAKNITVRQLLDHTAGIPNYTEFDEKQYLAILKAPRVMKAFLDALKKKPLDFTPGTQFGYSNSNYIFLGAIVSKITGTTFEEYAKENLFAKSGMKDSGVFRPTAPPPGIATGYEHDEEGEWAETTAEADFSKLVTDGALYSTVDDLVRWKRALYGGKILGPAALREMGTAAAKSENFGLGVIVDQVHGRPVIHHDGRVPGFLSDLRHFPEDDATIVLLSNSDNTATRRLGDELSALLFCKPVVPPARRVAATAGSAPGKLSKLAGKYRVSRDYVISIHEWNGGLYLQHPEGAWTRLVQESPTSFYSVADDDHITFRLRAGKPVGLTHAYHGDSVFATALRKVD